MIFVFGSNTEGRHGGGAAKEALDNWGAEYGNPRGRQGNSYAIVTKDLTLGKRSIPLDTIRLEVLAFLDYAEANPDETFLVTPIGTGLAGYTTHEIAQMFNRLPYNVYMPRTFLDALEKYNKNSTIG